MRRLPSAPLLSILLGALGLQEGGGPKEPPSSRPAFHFVKGALGGPSYDVKCEGVDAADLDGDGRLDLVFATGFVLQPKRMSPHAPQIQMNRTDAAGLRFVDEAAARLPAGFAVQAGSVTAFDADLDLDIDLVFAQMGGRPPAYLRNDGKGNFSDASADFPQTPLSSPSSEAGDVDDDGDLDLLLTDQDRPVRMYLNDGAGKFTDATQGRIPDMAIPTVQDATFADVDGDFDLDIVVLGKHEKGQNLFLNDGRGAFSDATVRLGYAGSSNNYEVEWSDLDNDGDVDAFWLSLERQVEGVSKNLAAEGRPLFFEHSTAPVKGATDEDDNEVLLIDVDDDGFLDPVVGSLQSSTERLYRNGRDFTFTNENAFDGERDPTCDAVPGDFDGDGGVDVATAQGESGTGNKVYRNMGPRDTKPPRLLRHDVPATAPPGGRTTFHLFVQDAFYDDGRDPVRGTFLVRPVGGGPPSASVPLTPMGGHLLRGSVDWTSIGAAAGSRWRVEVMLRDGAGNEATSRLGVIEIKNPPR